jgi:hypothetical protein
MMAVTVVTTATTAFNNFQNFALRMIAKERIESWVMAPRLVKILG